MRLMAAALALLMMFSALPAHADANDPALLASVENYLNGIKTLKARFLQTANDGAQASGDFMLKRPGRMRFQYDKPITDFIVADGMMVHYYDGKMKQESNAPISRSLADFFLREKLNLNGDLRVSDIKRANGQIEMTVVQSKDPLSGSLTLILGDNPMTLRAWRVVDAQGMTTTVALANVTLGLDLNNKYFDYVDPTLMQPHYNH